MSHLGFIKGSSALYLLTLIVFIPAMRADFIWDDDVWLWENKVIQDEGHWANYWLGDRTPDYLPVTSTVFWFEYHQFGRDATGYHVVNVLLHALGAVVLWRVFMRLGMSELMAWMAAAIFAVHPLNVSSVAWITELKNTLSLPLYALSILAYFRFEEQGKLRGQHRVRWFAVSLLFFSLGMLTKPSGVMLPFLIFAVRWWQGSAIRRVDLLRMLPFFAVSLLCGWLAIAFQHSRAIADTVVRPEGFMSRLAAAGCAVWFYLYKILLPFKLAMIYPRWQLNTASVLTYLPLLALAGMLYALWHYRDRIGRTPLFALGYFVVTLGPVLGFVPIYYHRYSLVADHWQYLAMPGLAALLVAGGAKLLHDHQQAKLPVAGGVIFLLSVLSFNHARSFENPLALWSDNVEQYPQCAAAQADLGLLLVEKKQYGKAIEHLRQAVDHEPEVARHWVKLGVAFSSGGQSKQAVRSLRRAVELDDTDVQARRYLGLVLMDTHQYAAAAEHYEAATKLKPTDGELHIRYADALAKSGQVDLAIEQLEKLMHHRPFWPDAMDMLARILARHRSPSRAIRLAERACDLDRHKSPRFIHTLAIAYAASGDVKAARQLAEMALRKAESQKRPRIAQELKTFLDGLSEPHPGGE